MVTNRLKFGLRSESSTFWLIKHYKLKEVVLSLTLEDREVLLEADQIVKRKIAEAGYRTRIEADFQKVRDQIEMAGKKVSPHFWPMFFDYNFENGFCMILEQDGEGLAYICYQRIDCGGMNFWQKHVQRVKQCFSHHPEAVFDESWVCEPMRHLTGVGAYSGDALVHPDWRAKGIKNYLRLISYLSQFLAVMHWQDLQWVGGLATSKHVNLGLGAVYGASHTYPEAERWISPPLDKDGTQLRENGYWFLSNHLADILYRARCVAQGHLLGT